MCAAADGSCTLLVEGATTAGPAALIYSAVACCAVAPCQPTVVLLCRACAAGVELFVAGVDGRRGRSLARLCAASSSAALVGRPVPAGDYPLLNPSRLQLLSGGQSALRAGIKLCGHLCSPSLRTRTAAILVGVLVHAAPLPRTSARLRPSSYTLCISAFSSIPSPSQSQFHPL